MIESYRNAKVIIVSGDEEEILNCERVVIEHLTLKNKRVEVLVRILLKDEKRKETKEK